MKNILIVLNLLLCGFIYFSFSALRPLRLPRLGVIHRQSKPIVEVVLPPSVQMQPFVGREPEKSYRSVKDTERVYQAAIYKSRFVNLNHVALSPDGKTLAVAGTIIRGKTQRTLRSNSLLMLLDARSGKRLTSIWKYKVDGLKFSPDGKWLITIGKKMRWWNMATGKLWKEVQTFGNSLAYSVDGKILAVADHESNRLDIWQRKPFRLRNRFGFMADPGSIAFSCDGQKITSSTGLIYDVASEEIRRWPRSLSTDIFERIVTLSPINNLKATFKITRDNKGVYNNRTIISSTRSERELWSIPFSVFPSRRSMFSPDGKRIILLHQTTYDEKQPADILARVYKAETGQLLQTIRRENAEDLLEATAVVFTPDGKTVILAGTGLDNAIKIVRLNAK